MEVSIVNSSSPGLSPELAEKIRTLDIYYQPAFLKADTRINPGEFELFTVNEASEWFIYPYIKMPVPGHTGYFDITSPYGYAGPYADSPRLFEIGEKLLVEYLMHASIVTEFIRYHYVYNASAKFQQNVSNHQNRTIVTLPLNETADVLWNTHFSDTNKRHVKKMRKEGYLVNFYEGDTWLNEFISLYEATMHRANATPFYYFPHPFYFDLVSSLGDKVFIGRVERERDVLISALFFKSGGFLTYFLSGKSAAHVNLPSANYLFSEVALRFCQSGYSFLNFGGGLTNLPDDSLLRFKKNFSTSTRDFFIGKRIHRADIYEQLVRNYIQQHGEEKFQAVKHILQFYRT